MPGVIARAHGGGASLALAAPCDQLLLARDRWLTVKRDRVGPIGGKLRNRAAAEFLAGDQTSLRRFEKFARDAALRVTGEDALQAREHLVGIASRIERSDRKAQLPFREIRH